MTGIPDLAIRVDIMGRVLDHLLCVFLADIQSVGIGACMHVCVWYTELTCISTGVWHHEMKANPTGYLWSSMNAL